MNTLLDKAPQVVLLMFGGGGVASVLIAVGASLFGHTLDAQTAQLVNQMLTVGVSVVAGAGTAAAAQAARGSSKQ